MRRRTLICVSFAVALHAAAFFAVDRFWFLAATPPPAVDRYSVIELLQDVPDPVAEPVVRAAVVPAPQLVPVLEPEKQPEPKSEKKIESESEPPSELEPPTLVQPDFVVFAPKAAMVVAVVTQIASAPSSSNFLQVKAAAVTSSVNYSTGANDHPFTVPVATPATYLTKRKLDYPAYANLKKQEGDVLLAVDVSANGRPTRVEVETSSGFKSLDEAAVAGVRRYFRFKPAQLDGKPVATRVQVPVQFRLGD